MTLRKLAGLLLAAVVGLLLWSCASIGNPEGGPRDYTPPVLVRCHPAHGTLNFKGNKVRLDFDEIVVLKDQQKKVVVSPAQKQPPSIKALGKSVYVEFNDTLKPNTTYTIDFSDALQDNNEGNRLENFYYTFSTGDSIDTLEISGIVLRASDLEPMQSVLVGATTNLDDSAFTTLPLERISKTNDKGQFTLRNLRPGRYHVFALNDLDGNYRMGRNESYAFLDEVIVPSVTSYTSQDTTFTFDRRVDTVLMGTHTAYLPNDILLSMFNEQYASLYLKKAKRVERHKLHVLTSAPNAELPRLDIISPAQHERDWYRLERNEGGDSLYYWLTDSALIKSDSIVVDLHYFKTDSTGLLAPANDTIDFVRNVSNAEIKAAKEAAKDIESKKKEMAKLRERRNKLASEGKEVMDIDDEIEAIVQSLKAKRERLELKMDKKSVFEVTDSISFTFTTPIRAIRRGLITLEQMNEDSTWTRVSTPPLRQASEFELMRYVIPMRLTPEGIYRLSVDSAAFEDIYHQVNDSTGMRFAVRSLDEYGSILLNITHAGDSAYVELLNSSGNLYRTAKVADGRVKFDHLLPAQYYLRLVKDENGNGKWDTGNYAEHRQPEEVYYYPWEKRMKVARAGWATEINWNIYETALDLQKPEKIKKNLPEKKGDSLEQRKRKVKDDEEDEFSPGLSRGSGSSGYSGNKYSDFQRNSRQRQR